MADHAERPRSDEYAEFYETYVSRVPTSGGLVTLLREQLDDTLALLDQVPEGRADVAYGAGKWTLKEVVGHVVDTERVFACRALCFARGEGAAMPGLDQDPYVTAGRFGERTLASLLAELTAVRQATILLFDGIPDEAWLGRGVASGYEVSVRAVACIIAGHELHHRAILADRYLPLVHSGG